MTQPVSWWTRVTLVDNDENSNKYYVMLSQKDYDKYCTDADYAAELLQQAKTQAIASSIRQQEIIDDNVETSQESAIINFQDGTCSPDPIVEDRDLYKEETSNLSDLGNLESKWTYASTTLLVEIVKQHCAGLRSPHVKKFVFWKKIKDIMKDNNYDYNWQHLQKKWCNLLGTYKRAKERQIIKMKSGHPVISRWAYLDAFDFIYQNDPKIIGIYKKNGAAPITSPASYGKKDANECSSDITSSDCDNDNITKVKVRKNSTEELKEIRKILEKKSAKETEALTILKKFAEVTTQQEDRRTQAIETLTTCVTQLTDAIKLLIDKQ